MLPNDAFLRRLPSTLNAKQVVMLEALVFCHDSVETAFETIEKLVLHYREKVVEADRRITVELFNRAWRIVDSLHTVRQVLDDLDYKTPTADRFYSKYDSASQMRNKMDHLKDNAQNFGKAKRRPPIFGTLSYICIPERNMIEVDGRRTATGGGIVVLTSGRVNPLGSRFRFAMPDLQQLQNAVKFFRFEAFDYILTLDEAVRDLRELVIEMNRNIEEQATKIAPRLAKTATYRWRKYWLIRGVI